MRVELNSERGADQLGHPLGRPQIGSEPVLGGRLDQPAENLFLLVSGQKWCSAKVGFGGKSLVPIGSVGSHPLGNGLTVDAQEGGHLCPGPTLIHSLDGQTTAGL